jgi:CheY-like chemotaxis protein
MNESGIILLAEDNLDDVLLVRMAFRKAGFDNRIVVVCDGEVAIKYLKGKGRYADRSKYPIPQIFLLDLKMPKVSGFEVLDWRQRRPEWKCLPTIVLTSSYATEDITRAYDLGANSFLTKPADFPEFVAIMKEMVRFWLGNSKLPTPGPFLPEPGSALEAHTALEAKVSEQAESSEEHRLLAKLGRPGAKASPLRRMRAGRVPAKHK